MTSKTQKKKGWLIPVDISEITDAPLISVRFCIPNTDGMIAATKGAINELQYWWNYEKSYQPDDTRARDVAAYIRGVLYESLCIGGCDMLRPSETNPCLIEQSTDCGETWTTLIDFSLCLSAGLSSFSDYFGQQLLDQLENLYDGTPGSVAPQMVYDGSPDDAFRDLVTCIMCEAFITTLSEAAVQGIERNLDKAQSLVNLVTDISLLIGPLLGPVAAIIAIGTAVAAAAVAVGQLYWTGIGIEIFQSDATRKKVACCMYDGLKGDTPTRSRFQASLDACGFTVLSPEAQLSGAISPLLQSLDMYLAFIKVMDEVYPLAQSGFLDTCICGNEASSVCVDFFISSEYEIVYGTLDGLFGNPAPSLKAERFNSNKGSHIDVDHVFDVPVTVTGVQFDIYNGMQTGDVAHGIYLYDADGNQLDGNFQTFPQDAGTWYTHAIGFDSVANVSRVKIACNQTGDANPIAGYLWADNFCTEVL